MTETRDLLVEALRRCLATHGYFSNEDGRRTTEEKIDLQSALVEQLGPTDCEREIAARFAPAATPPPPPPAHLGPAKDVCAVLEQSRQPVLLVGLRDRLGNPVPDITCALLRVQPGDELGRSWMKCCQL